MCKMKRSLLKFSLGVYKIPGKGILNNSPFPHCKSDAGHLAWSSVDFFLSFSSLCATLSQHDIGPLCVPHWYAAVL